MLVVYLGYDPRKKGKTRESEAGKGGKKQQRMLIISLQVTRGQSVPLKNQVDKPQETEVFTGPADKAFPWRHQFPLVMH